MYFLCRAWHFIKESWKSVHPFFPLYYKQTRILKIDKSTQDSRGWPQHHKNVSDCSLCQVRPFLKISWKSVQPFFCHAAKRHGFLRKKWKKKSCVQVVKWNILRMSPIVPCIKSHQPWKFHESPFGCFSVMLLTDRQTNRQTRATDNDENITFAMVEVMK